MIDGILNRHGFANSGDLSRHAATSGVFAVAQKRPGVVLLLLVEQLDEILSLGFADVLQNVDQVIVRDRFEHFPLFVGLELIERFLNKSIGDFRENFGESLATECVDQEAPGVCVLVLVKLGQVGWMKTFTKRTRQIAVTVGDCRFSVF